MERTKWHYMTLWVSIEQEAMKVACWVSTVDAFGDEISKYPFDNVYIGNGCSWLMHSNIEITPKIIQMAGEYADRICLEQAAKNDRRKIANR